MNKSGPKLPDTKSNTAGKPATLDPGGEQGGRRGGDNIIRGKIEVHQGLCDTLTEIKTQIESWLDEYVGYLTEVESKLKEKTQKFDRMKIELARSINSINNNCQDKCGYGIYSYISLHILFL